MAASLRVASDAEHRVPCSNWCWGSSCDGFGSNNLIVIRRRALPGARRRPVGLVLRRCSAHVPGCAPACCRPPPSVAWVDPTALCHRLLRALLSIIALCPGLQDGPSAGAGAAHGRRGGPAEVRLASVPPLVDALMAACCAVQQPSIPSLTIVCRVAPPDASQLSSSASSQPGYVAAFTLAR
jgi:hypothetical protein